MKISVWFFWHVIIKDDVDSLDIDSSSEDVSWNENSLLKIFERFVSCDSSLLIELDLPFILVEFSVNTDGWEVAIIEDLIKSNSSFDRRDKDNDLIELKSIQKVVESSCLLILFQLHIVLNKTM